MAILPLASIRPIETSFSVPASVSGSDLESLSHLEHTQWATWTSEIMAAGDPEMDRIRKRISLSLEDLRNEEQDALRYWALRALIILDARITDEMVARVTRQEHEQWKCWTRHMLSNLTPENIQRWQRQIQTDYSELSETEKDSDREWARKVIEIVRPGSFA